MVELDANFLTRPLNTERLMKLIVSYDVSMDKLFKLEFEPLSVTSKEEFLRTFHLFSSNA